MNDEPSVVSQHFFNNSNENLSYSPELIDISSTDIHLNAPTTKDIEVDYLSKGPNNKRCKSSPEASSSATFSSTFESNQFHFKYGNYKPMEWTNDVSKIGLNYCT